MVGRSISSAALSAVLTVSFACSESIDTRQNHEHSQMQTNSPSSTSAASDNLGSASELSADTQVDAELNRVLLALTSDVNAVDPNAQPSSAPSASQSADAGAPADAIGKISDVVFKLSDKVIAKLLEVFDADKNGKISKAEVMNLIMQKQEKFLDRFATVIKEKCGDQKDQNISPRCERLVKKFDADKDGKLSDSEIAEIEKVNLEKMVERQEKWVMSVAARLCLNNLNLCEQALVDELKAADLQAPKGLLDRLQGLIGKYRMGKHGHRDPSDRKDASQDLNK